MKTTTKRRTTTMAAVLAGAFGLTTAAAAAPVPTHAAPTQMDGGGFETNALVVQVLHSRTGKPLANMPVYITPLEGASFVVRVDTDANGMAVYTGLPDGLYRVSVIWNNNSAHTTAQLGSTDDVTTVTILFNPDID